MKQGIKTIISTLTLFGILIVLTVIYNYKLEAENNKENEQNIEK